MSPADLRDIGEKAAALCESHGFALRSAHISLALDVPSSDLLRAVPTGRWLEGDHSSIAGTRWLAVYLPGGLTLMGKSEPVPEPSPYSDLPLLRTESEAELAAAIGARS